LIVDVYGRLGAFVNVNAPQRGEIPQPRAKPWKPKKKNDQLCKGDISFYR